MRACIHARGIYMIRCWLANFCDVCERLVGFDGAYLGDELIAFLGKSGNETWAFGIVIEISTQLGDHFIHGAICHNPTKPNRIDEFVAANNTIWVLAKITEQFDCHRLKLPHLLFAAQGLLLIAKKELFDLPAHEFFREERLSVRKISRSACFVRLLPTRN